MSTPDTLPRWARGPLRPFRWSQYRWLIASVTLELLAAGTWLIAVVWQVIELDGGPGALSFAVTGWSLGVVVTTLIGGVVADRVPRRTILVVVTTIRLVAAVLVAGAALVGPGALWHLAAASLVIGMANGFYFPAYSALLPSVVEPGDLLAANGVEGMVRPVVMQAAGPAVASLVVAAWSPTVALSLVVVLEAACLCLLLGLRATPLERDVDPAGHPVRAALHDLAEGVRYMLRTPWFLATLLYASVMLLLVMGPIEVLVPFVVKDEAGGGPREHAWIMAAYGIGSAVGSLVIASLRLPRRYLTWMNVLWALSCLPLVVFGFVSSVPVMMTAMFVCGVFTSAGIVIWGTLLQRRVPPELLGRVSSLDFFVSIVFMPLSIAIAGPVSQALGLGTTFVVAGVVPCVLAVVAIVAARMPADEMAHPLDRTG